MIKTLSRNILKMKASVLHNFTFTGETVKAVLKIHWLYGLGMV